VPANWLEVDGNVTNDGKTLSICVPATLSKDLYKYDVKVEFVGNLDPRADVF